MAQPRDPTSNGVFWGWELLPSSREKTSGCPRPQWASPAWSQLRHSCSCCPEPHRERMEPLGGIPSYIEPWPAAFFAEQTQAELSRGLTAPPLLQQVHMVTQIHCHQAPAHLWPHLSRLPQGMDLITTAPGRQRPSSCCYILFFFSFEGQRGKRHLLSANQEQIVLSSADALLGHLATTREM